MDKIFQTKDLALATYVKLRGLRILKAARIGRDFDFTFADPDEQAEQLKVAYANSESQKFDSEMRTLKKLLANQPTSVQAGPS